MKLSRLGLIIILLLMSSLSFESAFAQCNLKAEAKVEKNSSGDATIRIQIIEGSGLLEFYLVDQRKTAKDAIVDKTTRNASELKNSFQVVFEGVKPSHYSIQMIDSKKCQVSIGGLQGILVSSN